MLRTEASGKGQSNGASKEPPVAAETKCVWAEVLNMPNEVGSIAEDNITTAGELVSA